MHPSRQIFVYSEGSIAQHITVKDHAEHAFNYDWVKQCKRKKAIVCNMQFLSLAQLKFSQPLILFERSQRWRRTALIMVAAQAGYGVFWVDNSPHNLASKLAGTYTSQPNSKRTSRTHCLETDRWISCHYSENQNILLQWIFFVAGELFTLASSNISKPILGWRSKPWHAKHFCTLTM